MKKMHPDFFTRMMWKGRTGLPMNVAIDDGYAYDFQQLPFVQVAFQMDTDEDGNMDNWWNIFCRLADGDRHLEPTTSRPMYMGVESDLGTNHGSELDCATKQSLRFGGREPRRSVWPGPYLCGERPNRRARRKADGNLRP